MAERRLGASTGARQQGRALDLVRRNAHRLLNQCKGRNNTLLKDPSGLEWLPNIHREDYRSAGMYSTYATSADGLEWDWHGPVLAARPGTWDARGARLTSVLPDGRASYR